MPTISALPAGTTLAGTEPIPAVQSGATVKTTPAALKTFIAPLTAKGDLLSFSTVPVKVGVGSDGQVLTASSGATPGVAWEDPSNTRPVRGTTQLSSGTKVVNTSQVTTNSFIFLTVQAIGTVTAPQALSANTIVGGVSFTITSADASDTSHVVWAIFEPNITP